MALLYWLHFCYLQAMAVFYTFYAFKCDIQYLLVSLLTFMCLYSKLDIEELSEKCHCDMDVVRRVSQTGKRDNIPISVHNCPK